MKREIVLSPDQKRIYNEMREKALAHLNGKKLQQPMH